MATARVPNSSVTQNSKSHVACRNNSFKQQMQSAKFRLAQQRRQRRMPNDRSDNNRIFASLSGEIAPNATLQLVETSSNESTEASSQIYNLPTDRLLTIREFCKRYKRSRSRAYQLIQSGALLAVKDGRSTLIPVDAAEAWIRQLPKV
jgi:excisionase family DNA binding protein